MLKSDPAHPVNSPKGCLHTKSNSKVHATDLLFMPDGILTVWSRFKFQFNFQRRRKKRFFFVNSYKTGYNYINLQKGE